MSTKALIPAADALGLDDISVEHDPAAADWYDAMRNWYGWTVQDAVLGARLLILADRLGWTFSWEDDWDLDHREEFDCYSDSGPKSCEMCILRDENGDVLDSLGCIDDADDHWRRGVEVELVSDALAMMDVAR